MKLLIVDDSNISVVILKGAIQKFASKLDLEIIGQAENGIQALEIFKKEMPDFVTMDVNMPEMDGLTALDEMMKLKPDVKVIIISGLSDKSTALDAMERGAVGFIQKPFTEDKLNAAFQKLLG